MPRKQDKYKAGVRPTELNFMVVKGRGRVRRFRVSSRLLVFSFMFFLAYITASLFAVNRYFALRVQVRQQAERIARLEADLTLAKNRLYQAEQRMALLEQPEAAAPMPVEHSEPNLAQGADKDGTYPSIAQPVRHNPSQIASSQDKPRETQHRGLVKIKDLKIKADPASLDLAFKVYNASDGQGPVKGYVHMIWLEDTSDLSKAWSYPNIALVNGLPLDYKTGRLFSIRRFREIRASFERKPDKALPQILRIVAFDKSGTEIFSKDYKVNQLIKGISQAVTPKSMRQQEAPSSKKGLSPARPKSTKALLSS